MCNILEKGMPSGHLPASYVAGGEKNMFCLANNLPRKREVGGSKEEMLREAA